MFVTGQIVRLKYRSDEYPLFVMVTNDWKEVYGRNVVLFSGTVLLNKLWGKANEPYRTLSVGHHAGSWDENSFSLSSLDELKNWI